MDDIKEKDIEGGNQDFDFSNTENAVSAAVLIQSFIRRKLARKRIEKFRQRVAVIKELAMTENKYLVSLRISTADYLHPLIAKCSTPEEVISASVVRTIFGSIEMVELLSKKLLVEFTKKATRITLFTCIGDVFLRLGDQLNCYADYVKHYDAARQALSEAMDPKGALAKFDLQVQQKHGIKLGIRDFLIMPVQRVPRYILLLKDILKHTEASHEDYNLIKQAMAKLQEFTVFMDMEAQRVEGLRIIESKLTGDTRILQTSTPDRRFVHEGALWDEDKGRKMYVFLFSDVLITAKEPDPPAAKGLSLTMRRKDGPPPPLDNKLQVSESILLTELTRCTNIKNFDKAAGFSFRLDGVVYKCTTEEERQIWIDQVHRVLKDLRQKAARNLKSSSQGATPSANTLVMKKTSASVIERANNRRSTSEYDALLNKQSSANDLRVNSPHSKGSSKSLTFGRSTRKNKIPSASVGGQEESRVSNPLMDVAARMRTSSGLQMSSVPSNSLSSSTTLPPAVIHGTSAASVVPVDVSSLPPPPVLPPPPTQAPEVAITLYPFTGSSEKEMTVEAGVKVTIVKQLASGWTVVELNGAKGAVPTTYLGKLPV